MHNRIKNYLLFIGFSTLIFTGCSNSFSQERSIETKEISSSSSSFQIQTKVTETSFSESTEITSSSEEVIIQPTVEDFVGGWGIPNSGDFFFINSDHTITLPEGTPSPMNLSFSTTEDGRFVMTNTVDDEEFSSILEPDGTLTASNGTTYIYLGKYDFHGWLEAKNEEMKQDQNADPIVIDPNDAIELAKKHMFQNDDSFSDSYHFENLGLEESAYRPYYSINVRQKAQNGFNSMHIGRIRVYTDNGACEWE
jgi:hypothetical protein